MPNTNSLAWTLSLLCALYACGVAAQAPAGPLHSGAQATIRGQSQPPRPPERVTLRFAPPNGLSFIQTDTTILSRNSSEDGKSLTTTICKRRVTIHKTAAGYTVAFGPLTTSTKKSAGGQSVTGGADFWQTVPCTYVLDGNGDLLDVRGLDTAYHALLKKLPPQLAQEQRPAFNKEAMVNQYKIAWQQEVKQYIGLPIPIGPMMATDARPGTKVTTRKTRQCTGYAMCNGRNCLRLLETEHSDPQALAAEINNGARAHQDTSGSAPSLKVLNVTHELSGERLIDPAFSWSLRIKSTTTDKTVVMKPTAKDPHHLHKVTTAITKTVTRTSTFVQ